MTARVGGATRVGAVIGWPVAHSRSPALHNAAFAATGLDAVFVALPVEPHRLPDALRGMAALGFLGASVTVPHKEAAVPVCDLLDASAEQAGAVNCIQFEGHRLVGHNTDAGGFVDALEGELGRSPTGLRALLLGGGGAARAVAVGLRLAGAACIEVVARSPERVRWCQAHPWRPAELASLCARSDLLVDCTSAGLGQAEYPAPVPLGSLAEGAAVASLLYGRRLPLLEQARALGLAAMDGAAMLVHQGARAFTIWTGLAAPVEAMRAAMAAG
ncbi:MAG TPA: shikimate dehydrogenase [Kofleriaceae bacterium]|nr:shikimate dehydrogenase [Kofleriaceae bacterium]